jgi:hypothetical protein
LAECGRRGAEEVTATRFKGVFEDATGCPVLCDLSPQLHSLSTGTGSTKNQCSRIASTSSVASRIRPVTSNSLAQRDLQRVGLSATVGNPVALLDRQAGSSQRPRSVVNIPAGALKTDVQLDYVGSLTTPRW